MEYHEREEILKLRAMALKKVIKLYSAHACVVTRLLQ